MKSMKGTSRALAGIAIGWLLAGAAHADQEALPQSDDGLELVTGGLLQLSYRRPDVNFGEYARVMFDPIPVAFSDAWHKDFPKVIASRRERIGNEIAEAIRTQLSAELHAVDGYATVTAARPDVLKITAAVAELYVSVLDQSFTADGGAYGSVYTQGLLIVEIRDAVSGLLLIRLADRTRADHELTGEAIRDTRLRADTGIVVERWVGGIREALANARIASQPSRAQD